MFYLILEQRSDSCKTLERTWCSQQSWDCSNYFGRLKIKHIGKKDLIVEVNERLKNLKEKALLDQILLEFICKQK